MGLCSRMPFEKQKMLEQLKDFTIRLSTMKTGQKSSVERRLSLS